MKPILHVLSNITNEFQTYYDFKKLGWQDANFIIHPEHFYMVAVLNKEGLYRITYGEEPGLSREQLQERMAWKFKTMLPGHPDPDQYKVVNFSPYKMHQRCAEKFRVGRFMLCADAAHLCCKFSSARLLLTFPKILTPGFPPEPPDPPPHHLIYNLFYTRRLMTSAPWGGMGISSGFVDVGGLYDCLAGIWDGVADEDILDLYSAKRIEKYKTIVDPISSENFRRVHDADPRTRLERDEFMQLCVKAETDKDLRRNMLMGGMDLRYDFTQHYKDKKGTKGFKDESSNLEKATNGVPQPVS